MRQDLYVVEFSSANYAGAPEHCRVWAISEKDAIEQAQDYANDFYYQQDAEQWEEEKEGEEFEGSWASVDRAMLQVGSEFEEYINDPAQAEAFYPIVNEAYPVR